MQMQSPLKIGTCFQLKEREMRNMAKIDINPNTANDAQQQYFNVTDQIPEQVWYWAALGSIIASATLFAMNKRDWSIFVGQWPPTFLLFGLYHKLLRPSR
jgi:hypothetical protein